ncbi:ABC transporter permease [Streptomyces europaeiscabiei]|uniref:Transport permease protein n=1 Tax=Streptomyces europaeiscabiei TaxID=146819 RepID=A0AAJ2PVK5_9ACTN|nr:MULTISPECIES: ABC transporter permease [Streptomyces]KFF96163.1 ABC transporter [Streptomyces scabiei]MDX3134510.1 ABC transporter permease [Streptomyces europaeiscabiei]
MTVSATAPAVPELKPGTAAKSVRDVLVVTRRNVIRTLRIPEVLVLSLVQPIVFVLLFAYIFAGSFALPGADGPSAYREYMMPGFFAQTIAFSTASNSSVSLANDVQSGMVDRFRSLPMARGALLTGRTLADLVQNVIMVAVMILCALLVGWRIHHGVLRAAAGFALLLLMGYALSWVGVVIGLTVRAPEAAASGNFLWLFPMTFLSNAFVAPSTLPTVLRWAAEWNPLSATVQAARELFGNPGLTATGAWPAQHPVLVSLAWSVLIAVAGRALAVRRYRAIGA